MRIKRVLILLLVTDAGAVGGHVTAAAHRDNWIGKGPGHKLGSSDS